MHGSKVTQNKRLTGIEWCTFIVRKDDIHTNTKCCYFTQTNAEKMSAFVCVRKRRHLFVCRHLGAGFDLILSGVAFDMAYKYVCVCVCV